MTDSEPGGVAVYYSPTGRQMVLVLVLDRGTSSTVLLLVGMSWGGLPSDQQEMSPGVPPPPHLNRENDQKKKKGRAHIVCMDAEPHEDSCCCIQ